MIKTTSLPNWLLILTVLMLMLCLFLSGCTKKPVDDDLVCFHYNAYYIVTSDTDVHARKTEHKAHKAPTSVSRT